MLVLPLGERNIGLNNQLRLLLLNGHIIVEVVRLAVHLDLLVKKLLLFVRKHNSTGLGKVSLAPGFN